MKKTIPTFTLSINDICKTEKQKAKFKASLKSKSEDKVDLSGAMKTEVLEYKKYKVFKTTAQNDYEIWDYTFRTPTTWLCYIFQESEYTEEKAKSKINECIVNNKMARESANG